MLQTRLWMGTILVLLTAGMLVVDQRLTPWFPFLFVFVLGLSLAACRELVGLLGNERRPQVGLLYVGVALLACCNWVVHEPQRHGWTGEPWSLVLAAFVALTLAVFLWEMATFQPDAGGTWREGGSVERMALTVWALGYLGLLPCFLVQTRWLYPANQAEKGSVALALLIFVPKGCDIGAYCTGRLLGRHKMTPLLSPNKTWEGAAGGLTFAVLTAAGIDRLGPVPLLRERWELELGFGVTLGAMGMLGDLAESLLKRDCRRKDASAAVPGFGGVLDIVDAVIFTAPVGYLWLVSLA
jgi:phosphatidate cytidylyltransferase